ncbi:MULTISPECIES: hypothetical protein [unclassified Streptomyces]|uniref:hypothetical protein n=1 Tax=unclassified Streptomyces TaxID=2593676 RepID=UPI000ABAB829|nr:hypothetical protein [Streptomyces sp. TSRI0281]
MDALALCHGHGSYLPRPYQETSTPAPTDVELRTNASDVADQLVRHDQQYGTSTTGNIPGGLEDGCTDSDRDAVRTYARREWITLEEGMAGHLTAGRGDSAATGSVAHVVRSDELAVDDVLHERPQEPEGTVPHGHFRDGDQQAPPSIRCSPYAASGSRAWWTATRRRRR